MAAAPSAEPPVRPGTNVAYRAKVTTSHEVEIWLSAEALTDGRPYSLVHPRDPGLGKGFYYQVDLGQVYTFDHVSLRQRNDRWDIDRMSRIHVELYEREPGEGVAPVWTAIDRADGSHPEASQVDILQAADGTGTFRGRYFRISSDSAVPKSPQLAEFEAYEIRTPQLVSVRGDLNPLAAIPFVSVPARTRKLHFALRIPQAGQPDERLYRWRLLGHNDEWQSAAQLQLERPCPPAGNYRFEAQAAHSDGTWDQTMLAFSLNVRPPFTETIAFRWVLAGVALLLGIAVSRSITRRRIAALEAQNALAEERRRIARDMHDDVGARLAQLAVLQDVFAREHTMPDSAKKSLSQLSAVARQAVASLDEVVWTVDPQNDTLASTAEHLAQHASEYLCPLRIAFRLVAPIEWPNIEIRAQVRHELILAFKEALQNIVKHSSATEVILTLKHCDGFFSVGLEDNGRGLVDSEPSPTDHHGLRNMSARMAAIGGKCKVENRSSGGTGAEFSVPLPSQPH